MGVLRNSDERVRAGGKVVRRLALVVALVAGVTVAANATPAAAASYQIVNTGGVGVRQRTAPTIASTYSGVAPEGATVNLECQQWSEAVGPYANRLWFRVNRAGTGSWWIADTYLNTPRKATDGAFPGVPMCIATPVQPVTPTVPSGPSITRSAPMYLCTNTAIAGCRPAGMPSVSTNQAVSMVCWQRGSWATGDYATDMWFWVTGPAGEGFVTASVVRKQASVAACSTRKAFVAADAAVARDGQRTASAADQTLFAASEWKPGPVAEWAGDCPKLPYVGWRAAGVSVFKGNAINNYYSWRNLNRIQGGVPPRGAIVFYNVTSYGHTAISLGNGYVATTQGMDFSNLPNAVKRYDSWTGYLGWVMPA
ncbi:MAG: CHAP domain-containing protein [Ilumatobacteraceae bacterium]